MVWSVAVHDDLGTRALHWSARGRRRAITAYGACAVLPDSPAALDASSLARINDSGQRLPLPKRRRRRAEAGAHRAMLEENLNVVLIDGGGGRSESPAARRSGGSSNADMW